MKESYDKIEELENLIKTIYSDNELENRSSSGFMKDTQIQSNDNIPKLDFSQLGSNKNWIPDQIQNMKEFNE